MQEILIALVSLLIGLTLLLYGYRVFHMMLPIWGFISGFWLGASLTALVLGTGFLGTIAGWVVGFIIGSISAGLAHFFHELHLGVVAATLGYAIGSGLLTALGLGPGLLSFLAGVALAFVVAALFYILDLKKVVITAVTAVSGGDFVLLGILLFIGRVSLESLRTGDAVEPVLRDSWFWLIAWLALAIIGFTYQSRVTHMEIQPGEL
jgi:hypothetical protein